MDTKKKQYKIDNEMGDRLENIVEGMSVKEYMRLVKIILEFIKVNAISIKYVSMLFRIIGEELEMDDFPDELFDIHNSFIAISGELEIPTTTVEEFINEIEMLLEKIK
ncbi:MAG: hypothetical protein EU536_03230 [Promethearchaeota archaeon]|nr:MAG: hypothetical protein EU536_03230 [Candidatus Lokiarchaeota archaeon]